jgi:predicted AAA+ superfamily ATPase
MTWTLRRYGHEATFWATHQDAELDLLLVKGGRRHGVEVKREDAPRLTPSMRIALEGLKLHHLSVFYPGDKTYPNADRVSAVPAVSLALGTIVYGRDRK